MIEVYIKHEYQGFHLLKKRKESLEDNTGHFRLIFVLNLFNPTARDVFSIVGFLLYLQLFRGFECDHLYYVIQFHLRSF
jgi:hypothetical protein